ncbi:MAG: hypothetical protein HY000_09815 [Planctomycetes bacterium]|nr:hypothetical protein [Planctomycetota bacterium]
MMKAIRGKVQGRCITFDEDLGIPDGEEVDVTVTVKPKRQWGVGIQRSAGAAADVPGIDEAFEQIERERQAARFRELGT